MHLVRCGESITLALRSELGFILSTILALYLAAGIPNVSALQSPCAVQEEINILAFYHESVPRYPELRQQSGNAGRHPTRRRDGGIARVMYPAGGSDCCKVNNKNEPEILAN